MEITPSKSMYNHHSASSQSLFSFVLLWNLINHQDSIVMIGLWGNCRLINMLKSSHWAGVFPHAYIKSAVSGILLVLRSNSCHMSSSTVSQSFFTLSTTSKKKAQRQRNLLKYVLDYSHSRAYPFNIRRLYVFLVNCRDKQLPFSFRPLTFSIQ